ncbi:right-handed parallel beta-helix repeat-containing protein, partial [Acinetobacter baumannii]|nr:right-handed parallel beta-helix repeat-containing protein [Acinetobacter baumannii]
YLQAQGVTPRALAPYVERRSSGHNGLITGTGTWSGAILRRLDRGADGGPYPLPPLTVGAQPEPVGQAGRKDVTVMS